MQQGQQGPVGAAGAQKMEEYDPTDEPSFGQWCMQKIFTSTPVQYIFTTLQHRNMYLNAAEQTCQQYPWTTAFVGSLAFAALYLSNNTLDAQRYPTPYLENPYSKLAKKIQTGRSVRKSLGGRPFYKYVEDMAKFGVNINEKKFREQWPEFVDEKEWFEYIYSQMALMQSGDDNEEALEEFMIEEQRKMDELAAMQEEEEDEEEDEEYEGDDDDDDDDYDDDDDEDY